MTEAGVFAILMTGVFFSAILYVAFGQITVRKLRKNPKTKNELGVEFVSGWDIFNVAQALALPQLVIVKMKKSRLSSFAANTELLFQHTTAFDRLLAKLFYWLFMSTGLSFALWALLDTIGVLS